MGTSVFSELWLPRKRAEDSDDLMGEAWSLLGVRGSAMVVGDVTDLMGSCIGTFGWLSLRPCPGRKGLPVLLNAFPWILERGRSTVRTRDGSYSCFCSRANMVLFLTRDAFWRRSIEERRVGEGEPLRPP